MESRVFVAGPVSWDHIVGLDALPSPVPHMEFARSHHWTVGGTSAGKALNLRSLGVPVTLRTVVGADARSSDLVRPARLRRPLALAPGLCGRGHLPVPQRRQDGYLAAHLDGRPIDACLGAAARQAARCIQSPSLAPLNGDA
jgi:hypothetical protein